jgi:hypothetical protein
MYRIFMCAAASALFISSQAVAQQKQQVSFKIPPENSKFITSQNVDIGDTPNHIVRIFDVRNTVPDKAAIINGLELGETFTRGVTDLVEGNGGSSSGYLVFVAKNGDKFFSRNTVLVQTVSGKLSATWVGQIAGGTGKFAGIQGTTRTIFPEFDARPRGLPGATQFNIEYSISK